MPETKEQPMTAVNPSDNGPAPLTAEALADRSRFQFRHEDLDLSEYISGIVLKLKSLSVAERDALPDLIDKDGNPDVSVPKLAAVFAAVVEVPKVTPEQAESFLKDWPAAALDKVIEKFGEMTGTREESKAAAGTFPDK
jgi:hypothetical protein